MGPKRILRGVKRRIVERWGRARERVAVLRHSRDLIWLGQHFGTDKWGEHWYLQHYQRHFQPFRTRRINLLEIGVGGYGDPKAGGNSLRMWKAYFPRAGVYGIDIYEKRGLGEDRVKIFQGSQVDETFLRHLVASVGGFDIVIDDGSHVNEHVIRSFQILFPLLRNPGIYVVEDTQTSYWPGYGGCSHSLGDPKTTMGYFGSLLHSLNYEEIVRDDFSPTVFDRHVVAAHFYHNLIFIHKGDNHEGSNRLTQNRGDAREIFEGGHYEIAEGLDNKK